MNAVSPDDLAANRCLEDSGYMEMLKMDKSVGSRTARIENLKELDQRHERHRAVPDLQQTLWNMSVW